MQIPSAVFQIFDIFTLLFSVSPTKRGSCRSGRCFYRPIFDVLFSF